MDLPLWIELVRTLGIPIGMLVVILPYHARVVREKDAELARVNELRVKEAEASSKTAMTLQAEQLTTIKEVDATLRVLNSKMS